MKFLEYTPLSKLDAFLKSVDVGDCLIEGGLEAYSCKLAGIDKKLSRSLEQEVMDSMSSASPQEMACSPLGPLTESSSRRTLIYLILTLNHMYPDYDFSNLRAHHFVKLGSIAAAKQTVDQLLLETAKVWDASRGDCEQPLLEVLWTAVDQVIDVVDCDVYSYNCDRDGDPFGEEGSIWSFNFFFYNKKLKRILYFSCRSISKVAVDDSTGSSGMESDWDGDLVADMDV
eukprot:jgi/Chlat1/4028/Chrsp26S04086